jgi:hypothetical protein
MTKTFEITGVDDHYYQTIQDIQQNNHTLQDDMDGKVTGMEINKSSTWTTEIMKKLQVNGNTNIHDNNEQNNTINDDNTTQGMTSNKKWMMMMTYP